MVDKEKTAAYNTARKGKGVFELFDSKMPFLLIGRRAVELKMDIKAKASVVFKRKRLCLYSFYFEKEF